jgi:hypothetical protein
VVEDSSFELAVDFCCFFVNPIDGNVLQKFFQDGEIGCSLLRFGHHIDEFSLDDRAGEEILFTDLGDAIEDFGIAEDDAAAMIGVEEVHKLELGLAAAVVDRLKAGFKVAALPFPSVVKEGSSGAGPEGWVGLEVGFEEGESCFDAFFGGGF